MQNSDSAITRCENPSFRLWRRTNYTFYTLCLCSVRTELSCHHSSLMVDGDGVFLDVCACWFDRCAPPPDCRFTCHYRCRALIRVDCIWDRGSATDHTCVVEHTVETDTNVVSVPRICPPSQGGSWWNSIIKRSKGRENQEICKMLHTNASITCWGSKGGT